LTIFILNTPVKARWITLAVTMLATVLMAHYFWAMATYLGSPIIDNNIVAHFAVQAQSLLAGGELYGALDAANRGSSLYGPTGYLTQIPTMLLVSDPILGAKLSGVLLALGSLALLAWRLWVLGGIQTAASGVAFFLLVETWQAANVSYWSRSDSLLIFGCTLGFAAVMGKRPGLAVFLAGLGGGLAAGGKITAAFCFLPVAWIILRRWGWLWFGLWTALAVAWTLLPFILLDGISLPNYLDWLVSVGGGHDLIVSTAIKSLRQSVLILAPALLLLLAAGRGVSRRLLVRDLSVQALLILGISFAFIIVLSSKEGAGSYHLLPLVPATALLAAWSWHRLGRDNKAPWTRRRSVAIVMLAVAWFGMAVHRGVKYQRIYRGYVARMDHLADARRDLEGIRSRHAGRTMAMGYAGGSWDDPEFHRSYLRPLLNTGENFLDFPAVMDAQGAGIPLPEATRCKMRSRPYDYFVIPRGGRPFSSRSHYRAYVERMVFEDLGEIFQANYHLVESTEYFDLWAAIDRPDL
jgi:hypothetical protein